MLIMRMLFSTMFSIAMKKHLFQMRSIDQILAKLFTKDKVYDFVIFTKPVLQDGF